MNKIMVGFIGMGLAITSQAAVFSFTPDADTLNASAELSGIALPQGAAFTDLNQNALTWTDYAGTLDLTISANDSEELAVRNYGTESNNAYTLGIQKVVKADEVSSGELLTVSASESFSLSSLVLTGYGNNDLLVKVGGLGFDPGTLTFSSFGTDGAPDTGDSWTTSYDAGTDVLTIDIAGFAVTTLVSFENAVDTTSFTFTSTTSNTSSGGVGFGGFAAIPEPATLGLITASGAGLLFVRRRLMM